MPSAHDRTAASDHAGLGALKAASVVLAAAALFSFATPATLAESVTPPGPSVRFLVQRSPLAGFRHHEAAAVWSDMRVGDRLDLLREADNPHDANAVRVQWHGRMLGYVPRSQNQALAWAMDRGEAVTARIASMRVAGNARRILEFEVFVE